MPAAPPSLIAASTRPRSAVGRADLLLGLAALGESSLAALAALAGFEFVPHEPPLPAASLPPPLAPAAQRTTPTGLRPPLRALHYAVVAQSVVEPDASNQADTVFDAHGRIFDQSLLARQDAAPPQPAALVPARRMAAMVRTTLRPLRRSRQVDINRWIGLMAQARPPQRLPLRLYRSWTTDAGLIVQASADFTPFEHDAQTLAAQVLRWSGGRATVLRQSEDGRWAVLRRDPSRHDRPWLEASAAQAARLSSALVLGSGAPGLAAIDGSPPWLPRAGRAAWPAQGLTLLLPAGQPLPPADWPRSTRVVEWDHGSRLRRRSQPKPIATEALAAAAAQMLVCLSLAVVVEPHLLRALRLRLRCSAQSRPTWPTCMHGWKRRSGHRSRSGSRWPRRPSI